MTLLDRLIPSRRNRDLLYIHATEDWYDKIVPHQIDFFHKIELTAPDHGYTMRVLRHGSVASKRALRRDNLHIVIGHRKTQGPRVFHTHPSYLWGFWYLDPAGYYWTSSLVDKTFDPATINTDKATWFFNGVTGHMIRNRISKMPQPEATRQLSPAKIAVFTQQIDAFKRPIHYLDTAQMIAAAAQSTTDQVYVKMHPVQDEITASQIRRTCAGFSNVVMSDAHVFDIIGASEIIMSQNSAVGFEALMHRKPVITCAVCDYHHASIVAKSADDVAVAVESAAVLYADFDFAAYLYWFLSEQMLEPQKDAFTDRAWSVLLNAHPT